MAMGSRLLLLFACKTFLPGDPERRSSPTTASSRFVKNRQRVDSARIALDSWVQQIFREHLSAMWQTLSLAESLRGF